MKPTTLSIGPSSQVGPYRLVATLGHGGMGVVFRGVHVETGHEVAVKTVRATHPGELSSLRQEIYALTRIQHPGVVRFIDQGVEHGRPWYAMELLQSRTLLELCDEMYPGRRYDSGTYGQNGTWTEISTPDIPLTAVGSNPIITPMPTLEARTLERVLPMMYALCGTLAFIHSRGIVHRDLKLTNVFLRDNSDPVLTDFGLVSSFQGEQGREILQLSGSFQGTPGYAAPEQILGELVDARADLYALGCILYELITGTPPFTSNSPFGLLHEHVYSAVAPPSERIAGVPADLEKLILKLLAKEPRERLGHADDVATALAAIEGCGIADNPRTADLDIPSASYLYRPSLVGREDLLADLTAHLPELHYDQGGMALICGESGVGKTLLATSLTAAAAEYDVDVVLGECRPWAGEGSGDVTAAPLHPLRPLLQRIADLCVANGPETTDRLLGAQAKVLATYEPALAMVPGIDNYPEPPALPAEITQKRLIEGLKEVLANLVQERPLLLVLDDLQWADDLSMRLLHSFSEADCRQRGIFIVGTYRVEETTACLRDLARKPWVVAIQLTRLDEGAIGMMAGDMLGLPQPPRALVQFLTEQSAGVPFFAAEYLRTAVAEGLLYRQRGHWRLRDDREGSLERLASLPLSNSLQVLICQRLARLSAPARRVVEIAAVLGREVANDLLIAACGLDEIAAFEALQEAFARQVLEQRRDGRVRFMHDKLRETSYQEIASARRPELHRIAAQAIEDRYGDASDFAQRYNEMIGHWRLAGDSDRTLHYLEQAGRHAIRAFAYADAVRFFDEAVELHAAMGGPEDRMRRSDWEYLLGEAHTGVGTYAQVRIHLERAVALADIPMPQGHVALIRGVVREGLVHGLHHIGLLPRQPHERGTAFVEQMADAYGILTGAYVFLGDAPRFLFGALRTMNLADSGGSVAVQARAYGMAQLTTDRLTLHRLAGYYAKLAERTVNRTTNPVTQCNVMVIVSLFMAAHGRWRQLMEATEAGIEIAERIGFRSRAEDLRTVQAQGYWMSGNLERAQRLYHQVYEATKDRSLAIDRYQAWSVSYLLRLALISGDLAAAQRYLDWAAELSLDRMPVAGIIPVLTATASIRMAEGDLAGARHCADEATAWLVGQSPTIWGLAVSCSALIEIYVTLWQRAPDPGERQHAATNARVTLKMFRSMARRFPSLVPDALYWRGVCDVLQGRRWRARRYWQRSLEIAESLGMFYHQARAHRALSRVSSKSSERWNHTERATTLGDRLGVMVETTLYGLYPSGSAVPR